MPSAAPRPCSHPGCGALVRDGTGRCPSHPRQVWAKKADAPKRVTGRRLQRMREQLMREQPLCVECQKVGIVLEPKYREPTQREQLEYALVSGAASALAISPGNARQVVDGINVVLDTLHPLPTLSNPHTGTPRDPRDVASDPQAVLCLTSSPG